METMPIQSSNPSEMRKGEPIAEYIEVDKDSERTYYQNLMNPNEYAQYLNSIVAANADSMVKTINVKLNKNFFES